MEQVTLCERDGRRYLIGNILLVLRDDALKEFISILVLLIMTLDQMS